MAALSPAALTSACDIIPSVLCSRLTSSSSAEQVDSSRNLKRLLLSEKPVVCLFRAEAACSLHKLC